MKKITCASVLIAISACLPASAQTAGRLSPEELLARAVSQNVCGENTATSAVYESATSNLVRVTCQPAGAAAEFGAGMGAGAAGVGALVVLVALAAGGGGGTPSTPSTN